MKDCWLNRLNEQRLKQTVPCHGLLIHACWDEALPEEYRARIDTPVYFEKFVDEDARSEKTHGFDEFGEKCYYRHAFLLTCIRSDDDEIYYESRTFAQEVAAWRLSSGGWLSCTQNAPRQDECKQSSPVYRLQEEAPR